MKKYYSDRTKYPKLFKQCYWGMFTAADPVRPERAQEPDKAIVAARNRFVEEYKIVAYPKMNLDSVRLDQLKLDHQEFWEDDQGRIVHLFSHHPTLGVPPEFRVIYSLYSQSQVTGLRIVETLRSKRKLLKAVFKKVPDEVALIINLFITGVKKAKRRKLMSAASTGVPL